jgi:hypothetical protein
MKKTILILVTLALFLSCNSDDGNGQQFTDFNDPKIRGMWYFSKVILPDDSIKDYVNKCPNFKDGLTIYPEPFTEIIYTPSCLRIENVFTYTYFPEYNVVTLTDNKFNGTYTLSGNTLRIDYGEVRTDFFDENQVSDAKGLILTRN